MVVIIFIEEGQLGVDEPAFKSILVGYPDGGLVEDLPWKDHGLRWVIRGPITCKRYDLASDGIISSYGVGPDSKGV